MEFNATFIVSAISFIVFVLIMNWIFYKPIHNIVQQRKKIIDDANEEAKINTQKSEAILKDKEKKLTKTRQEAKKIILDKSEETKIQKSDMTSQAQQKASKEIEEEKGKLYKSSDEARSILSEEAKKLADVITSKILNKT